MTESIKRMSWLVLVACIAAVAHGGGTARAQDPGQVDSSEGAQVPAVEPKVRDAGDALEPWRQEILELRRAADERREELQAAFDAESDPARRLEIEAEMGALKLGVQLRVLEVQVREARALGREDAAVALEQTIGFLEAERGRNEPLAREEVKRKH